MTEEQGMLLLDLTNEFYKDYSKLVANTLRKAPKELRVEALTMIMEKSNVYGSNYEAYMPKVRK